jgi:hypothetical protein
LHSPVPSQLTTGGVLFRHRIRFNRYSKVGFETIDSAGYGPMKSTGFPQEILGGKTIWAKRQFRPALSTRTGPRGVDPAVGVLLQSVLKWMILGPLAAGG